MNKTEFITELFKDEIGADISKMAATYDIGFIIANRDLNIKTGEVKIKSFTVAMQFIKTGFLASSKVFEIKWLNHRKAFDMIMKDIESDEYIHQDFYNFRIYNAPYKASIYVKKNPEIKIQNKVKLSYKLIRRDIDGVKGQNQFKEFFEITFKNFNDYPIFIPTSDNLDFWKYFENREIKEPMICFENEIERSISSISKTVNDFKEQQENISKKCASYEEDLVVLKEYQKNSADTRNKLYNLFSEEEIAAHRLLKEMRKFGG